MNLNEAKAIAEKIKKQLEPHCHRIEIAGSIRRRAQQVKDIEIVAIPKPYDTGLFESGIATIINQWESIKGQLPCRYTQRKLPEGINLDIFFATQRNWGLIFAIRTGSAEYSHKVLACAWVQKGYNSEKGMLKHNGKEINILEEKDLYERLNLPYLEPWERNI